MRVCGASGTRWDYGYQIAGIANRTTLADGNTWNQDHIALLGLTLTAPVPEAHALAAHLVLRLRLRLLALFAAVPLRAFQLVFELSPAGSQADYILVWLSSDLGKAGHMARIANSFFHGHCYDSSCEQYGSHRDGSPSAMQKASLMWHLMGKDGPDGPLPKVIYPQLQHP